MSERILIIDESVESQQMLIDTLDIDGYDLFAVADTSNAMASILEKKPAVILLNSDLGGECGIEFLNCLKKDNATRDISVIMVAEQGRDEKIIGSLEIGATDYIPQPVSPGVVRARVRNVLRVRRIQQRIIKQRTDAQTAADAKLSFLTNMSHEIRTPMTAILGFADLLSAEGDITRAPKSRLHAIRTIQRNGRHLLELINDILDLSKIEAGMLDVDPIRCSACHVAADVVSVLRVRAENKHIHLKLHFDGLMPETVYTDTTRLRQILLNLVSNAVKFTDAGEVLLSVRLLEQDQDQPRLEFTVKDTGIGLTDEQIGRLFRPFSQATPVTSRKYGGTGLGLAVSKQLVTLLGGDISVTSEIGVGSAFRFSIQTGALDGVRLLKGMTEAKVDLEEDTKDIPLAQDVLEGRILLADDCLDNQRLLGVILGAAGAEVVFAENGRVAIERVAEAEAEQRPFDIILMDMQMPELDGYGATRLLRDDGCTLPIIALTASAMSGDRQKCLDAGCTDYASKPVNRHTLITLVKHHLKVASKNKQASEAPVEG